ncbi:MAG: ABC transporter substrate-binding protein [Chloroflexi bacterium]|nr:ABC transporter substrate-binding protein [Chloroflexota bacterium]
MRTRFGLLVTALVLLGLVVACAAPATPAPTVKPAAPAGATAAPAATAAPVATKAPAAAPAPTQPAPTAKVKRGGTLRYASSNDPNSWDPIFADNTETIRHLPVYENLVRWNLVDEKTGKYEIAPQLAESWKYEDQTHIIFNLRKGVKFHDGSDFNAEVAKWNLERARDDKKSLSKRLVEDITTFTVVDPYTLRFTLKAPTALTLVNMTRSTGGTGGTGSMMASKSAFEKLGADGYAQKPSGTGPMKMTEWSRDDRAAFARFDGYWGKGVDGQPLPYLDGIQSRVIRDKTVILAELRSGTIDAGWDVTPQNYASVKANPELVLVMMPAAVSRQIIGFNQDRPPFGGNIKLMEAAQYAIDREALAKNVGFGVGMPLYYGLWIPTWPGYDETLPKYEFNPTKAKQLMAEAGFPNGLDVEISYQTTTPLADKATEMIERMWQAIGLRGKILGLDSLAFKDKNKAGEFEAANWYMTSSPDIALYNRMYLSDGAANWSNFHDTEVDKCMKEGAGLVDFAARDAVYKRCIKLLYEAAAVQGLYAMPNNIIYRKEVKGIRPHIIDLDMFEAWLDK